MNILIDMSNTDSFYTCDALTCQNNSHNPRNNRLGGANKQVGCMWSSAITFNLMTITLVKNAPFRLQIQFNSTNITLDGNYKAESKGKIYRICYLNSETARTLPQNYQISKKNSG